MTFYRWGEVSVSRHQRLDIQDIAVKGKGLIFSGRSIPGDAGQPYHAHAWSLLTARQRLKTVLSGSKLPALSLPAKRARESCGQHDVGGSLIPIHFQMD